MHVLSFQASDVYQLKDIISEDDSSSLGSSAACCLAVEQTEIDTWGAEKRYTALFMTHINRLRRASSIDEKTKLKLIEALIYTECLIKMSSLKFGALKNPDPVGSDFPSELQRRVKERFYPIQKG